MTFDEFFAAQYARVVAFLTVVVGDRDRAEEAAQEAFARALRRWTRVGTLDRLGTWVYVVALRAERRRMRRQRADDGDIGVVEITDLDPTAATSDALWVRTALRALPPRQRAAVVLRYIGQLRLSEIAEVMGCSTGTVKSTLHAALANLRVELEPEAIDAG